MCSCYLETLILYDLLHSIIHTTIEKEDCELLVMDIHFRCSFPDFWWESRHLLVSSLLKCHLRTQVSWYGVKTLSSWALILRRDALMVMLDPRLSVAIFFLIPTTFPCRRQRVHDKLSILIDTRLRLQWMEEKTTINSATTSLLLQGCWAIPGRWYYYHYFFRNFKMNRFKRIHQSTLSHKQCQRFMEVCKIVAENSTRLSVSDKDGAFLLLHHILHREITEYIPYIPTPRDRKRLELGILQD